jgi:predicted CoA-binding protein
MEHSLADVKALLASSPVIAVLGAHPSPDKPAHYVPAYLATQGYRVLPVNAAYVGTELFGETVRATLAELERPVDLVDVFRRADALASHEADLLAMRPLPRVVWLQQGIRNDAFAERLRAHGITVVQDRCTLADHRALGLGTPLRREE